MFSEVGKEGLAMTRRIAFDAGHVRILAVTGIPGGIF